MDYSRNDPLLFPGSKILRVLYLCISSQCSWCSSIRFWCSRVKLRRLFAQLSTTLIILLERGWKWGGYYMFLRWGLWSSGKAHDLSKLLLMYSLIREYVYLIPPPPKKRKEKEREHLKFSFFFVLKPGSQFCSDHAFSILGLSSVPIAHF